MRVLVQIIMLYSSMCVTLSNNIPQELGPELPIDSNIIQRSLSETEQKSDETKALKKVFLSNKLVTCNDGSQAGFYLRKSHRSKKWIVFLEGGWYCYDNHSCRNRWLRQRHYMTSSQWSETRDVGGILSPNKDENPFWWNANHVFVPYCTSDSWSGSKSSRTEMFSFMGSVVIQQVVRDLVPLGLENSTDFLLAGSSAGGTGVLINLDPVQELINEVLDLPHVAVRGITDSGWFLDRDPYAPTGKPAVDAIRKGMELWQGKVPRRCRQVYEMEPWRCYFGYRLYPTLKSPLFVFQWLFDEAQMDADNVGAPVTKQQWDYIHKMGDALRHSFQNVSAVFAPSCISHSVLTKRDWQNVKIDDVSIADAIHCWEQRASRRKIRRLKQMYADQPVAGKKHSCKFHRGEKRNSTEGSVDNNRRQRRKHKKRRKNGHKDRRLHQTKRRNNTSNFISTSISTERPRPQRSVLHQQGHKPLKSGSCVHKRLERCSWPQCNHSCPKLHNPFTGEEMDFIELLKSFGLDMERVAKALGIDMQTLNNMDHAELLNLLTQQSN